MNEYTKILTEVTVSDDFDNGISAARQGLNAALRAKTARVSDVLDAWLLKRNELQAELDVLTTRIDAHVEKLETDALLGGGEVPDLDADFPLQQAEAKQRGLERAVADINRAAEELVASHALDDGDEYHFNEETFAFSLWQPSTC